MAHELNSTSIQTPIDMADRHLNTRSMLKKRVGRPRSAISKKGEITAPAAASAKASRTNSILCPVRKAPQRDDAAHSCSASHKQIEADLPGPHRRLDYRLPVVSRNRARTRRPRDGPAHYRCTGSSHGPVRCASSRSESRRLSLARGVLEGLVLMMFSS